jgi:hypothetical protein
VIEYPKIQTLWKRQSEKPHNMIVGEYATPEFAELHALTWRGYEKLDGTNVRVMWDGDKVRYGGKTERAQMPMPLIEALDDQFGGEVGAQMFEQTFGGTPACLYGEGYGPGIQKGGVYGNVVRFAVFDVRVGGASLSSDLGITPPPAPIWLRQEDVDDVARKMGLERAPFVAGGSLGQLSDTVAAGIESMYGGAQAEGLILRPPVDLLDRQGNRILSKLKTKDFQKLDPSDVFVKVAHG